MQAAPAHEVDVVRRFPGSDCAPREPSLEVAVSQWPRRTLIPLAGPCSTRLPGGLSTNSTRKSWGLSSRPLKILRPPSAFGHPQPSAPNHRHDPGHVTDNTLRAPRPANTSSSSLVRVRRIQRNDAPATFRQSGSRFRTTDSRRMPPRTVCD